MPTHTHTHTYRQKSWITVKAFNEHQPCPLKYYGQTKLKNIEASKLNYYLHLFGEKKPLEPKAESLDGETTWFLSGPSGGGQGLGASLGGFWWLCLVQVPPRQAWSPQRAPLSLGNI